eukprot:scaffold4455_cov403-Prasinococcus_capsulatus_cf.AAC.4
MARYLELAYGYPLAHLFLPDGDARVETSARQEPPTRGEGTASYGPAVHVVQHTHTFPLRIVRATLRGRRALRPDAHLLVATGTGQLTAGRVPSNAPDTVGVPLQNKEGCRSHLHHAGLDRPPWQLSTRAEDAEGSS